LPRLPAIHAEGVEKEESISFAVSALFSEEEFSEKKEEKMRAVRVEARRAFSG